MVDDSGVPWTAEMIPLKLRFAKAVRISVDGNAHFCRGMLRTRYPESAAGQSARRHESLGISPVAKAPLGTSAIGTGTSGTGTSGPSTSGTGTSSTITTVGSTR
jgi:hypothetical protein